MKLRILILFSLGPWLFYGGGELFHCLGLGSGCALGMMLLAWSQKWFHLKWTDWTQCIYFVLVFLAAILPLFHRLLDFRSMLAPALFLSMTLGSICLGQPFTNQFAREQIPVDYWKDRAFPFHFARVNYILTVAWGINFGVALICAWMAHQGPLSHAWMLKGIVISSFITVVAITRFFPDWYEAHIYRPNLPSMTY